MAHASNEQGVVPGAFARFFNSLTSGFSRITLNGSVIRRLSALSEIGDTDFQKHGLRREEAVRRVLAGRLGF